jgi:hypothetical protein
MPTTYEQPATSDAALRKQAAARAAARVWNVTVVPDGVAAARFLNLAPAQGVGEGFVSLRLDGRMDVYFFL